MADKEPINSPEGKVPRRLVLKALGYSALAAILAGCGLPPRTDVASSPGTSPTKKSGVDSVIDHGSDAPGPETPPPKPTPTEAEKERLKQENIEKAGLGAFTPLWITAKGIDDNFRTKGLCGNMDFSLKRAILTYEGVREGVYKPDSNEVKILRDGWAEDEAQAKKDAVVDAKKNAEKMEILCKTPGQDEVARGYLRKLADYLPTLIVGTKQINLLKDNVSAYYYYGGLAKMDNPEPKESFDTWFFVWFHESFHEIEDIAMDLKKYMTRPNFVHYWDERLKVAQRAIEKWSKPGELKPEEATMFYLGGRPILWNEKDMPLIKIIGIEKLSGGQASSSTLPEVRLNIAVFNCMRRIQEINQRNYLAPGDKEFLENPLLKEVTRVALSEFLHRYVDPRLSTWPEGTKVNNFMFVEGDFLQGVKLGLVSTLPPELRGPVNFKKFIWGLFGKPVSEVVPEMHDEMVRQTSGDLVMATA